LLLTVGVVLALVGSAVGFDLGARRPEKAPVVYPQSVPDPGRQGGDTILDAVVISLPYSGVGTTVGYSDDYDEECPYTQSTSPDVVYRFTPEIDEVVDIDMLGSAYDTKIYVYDENLALVACNDDFYPDYTSKIESLALMAGMDYYLVIDGYGGDAGDYVLNIVDYEPCVISCPSGAQLEGEPPLVDGYVDLHNGGCNTDGVQPFGSIDSFIFCGTSGWYLTPDGSQFRDTDWYELVVNDLGFIEIYGDAEVATYMFELGPQDCDNVAVIQQSTMGPCHEAAMFIFGVPGSIVWFWVGPTTFDGTGEYDYVLIFGHGTATEPQSWSAVKSIFD